MINSAQALVTGFEPNTEKSFESLNIEDGINAFFKSQSLEEARLSQVICLQKKCQNLWK